MGMSFFLHVPAGCQADNRSLYCLVLGLLVTYKVPELEEIQVPGVEIAIIKGYHALKTWEKSPSIGICVQRIEDMMNRLEIPLQEPNPFSPHD